MVVPKGSGARHCLHGRCCVDVDGRAEGGEDRSLDIGDRDAKRLAGERSDRDGVERLAQVGVHLGEDGSEPVGVVDETSALNSQAWRTTR